MTADNDREVDQPTSVGAGNDETAFVPPPTEAGPELAWSLADDVDTVPVERPWGLAWGQATVFLSIGAVVALVIAVVGWTIGRSDHEPQPLAHEARPAAAAAAVTSTSAAPVAAVVPPSTVTAQAVPTTVTVQAPAPPPKTTIVTVQAPAQTTTVRVTSEPPPEANVVPQLSQTVYDQRFLEKMRSLGYTITNESLAVRNAHEACRLFGQGETATQVNEQMSAKVGASMTDTLQLTSSAILAYPNCFKGGD